MSERYSIYLQRRKLELVGTLWLRNTRGHISSAFTYDPYWLGTPGAFALSPDLPLNLSSRVDFLTTHRAP